MIAFSRERELIATAIHSHNPNMLVVKLYDCTLAMHNVKARQVLSCLCLLRAVVLNLMHLLCSPSDTYSTHVLRTEACNCV